MAAPDDVDDLANARTPDGRCPRCGQLWPASAPRCFGCDHADPARRGGQVKLGNLVVFGVAVLAGLGFVVVHNRRRQAEHPPLPAVTAHAQNQGQDYIATAPPEPPPNIPHHARACGFTGPELAALVAPYRAALAECGGGHPLKLGLVFDPDGKGRYKTTATILVPPNGPNDPNDAHAESTAKCGALLEPLHVDIEPGRNGTTGPMHCVLKL